LAAVSDFPGESILLPDLKDALLYADKSADPGLDCSRHQTKEPYMKRIITAAILLSGAVFGIGGRASAQEAAVKVDVPFDFSVGSHALPAGSYRIAAHGDSLAFENHDKKAFLFTLAARDEMATDGQSKLIFDNVHGQYFLRRIETASAQTSVEFPVSKQEMHSQEVAQSRTIYAETASR
jgi:hypothetical protein